MQASVFQRVPPPMVVEQPVEVLVQVRVRVRVLVPDRHWQRPNPSQLLVHRHFLCQPFYQGVRVRTQSLGTREHYFVG